MPNILFSANVKELTVGQGLNLANTDSGVNLTLSGAGLSQFLLNNCIDGTSTVGVTLVGGRLRLEADNSQTSMSAGFSVISSLSEFDANNQYQVTGNLILDVSDTTAIVYQLIYPDFVPRLFWLYIENFPTVTGSQAFLTVGTSLSQNANLQLNIGRLYAILPYVGGIAGFEIPLIVSNS